MKIEEYLTWKKENDSFLKMLESSASVLLSRMDEIFKVLDKIIELKERKLPIEEYQIFFEVGYSYLYDRINEIKIYFQEYFLNSKMLLKKYEVLISYLMYLEDYLEALKEKQKLSLDASVLFDRIFKEIDEILKKNQDFSLSLLDRYDLEISNVIKFDKDVLTTLDIFALAYEDM
ncbi:MAG: hypothetical protein ACOX4W_06325 [Bacilli bacterium]